MGVFKNRKIVEVRVVRQQGGGDEDGADSDEMAL